MGPTASGKTAAAITLAKRLPCDIISVDSALVYRGMDIGTAKPDAATLRATPHRLIDIRDPSQPYSAGEFCADALREMRQISQAGRIPLLVGGTMLYYRALLEMDDLPAANPAIRQQLATEMAEQGLAAQYQRLVELDSATALRLHPHDTQRIHRALELIAITGQPLSQLHQRQKPHFPYQVFKIALMPERAELHQRIEQRLAIMFEQNFLAEVRTLFARDDLNGELPAMRAVGYRQLWAHLAGEDDYATACQKALFATRQLAKRQVTWLRRETQLHTLNPCDSGFTDKLCNFADQALSKR